MPLVSESLYTQWFSRSSWCYHSFSYLFINPLWQKQIPKGVSLCPYFWSAVLSFVVFRPLVYLTLGLRWVATTLRLNAFIRWTDKVVCKVIDFSGEPFMIPTMLGAVILTGVSLLLHGLWLIQCELYSLGVAVLCWSPIVCFAAFVICLIHWENTKRNANRCRVEIYLRTLLFAAVTAAAIQHTALFVDTFIGLPTAGLVGVWGGICWTVMGVLSIIKWTLLGALTGLPYALATMVALAVLSVIGYRMAGRGELPAIPEGLTKAEIAANVEVIAKTLWPSSPWTMGQCRQLVRGHEGAMQLARSAIIDQYDVPNALIEALNAHGNALDKERDLKAAQKAASRSATCKRVTEALARLGAPFAVVGRQVKIAWSYGWALVKARKQSACPFVRFHD